MAQECACNDAYGIHCKVHDDQRFAKLALGLHASQQGDPADRCGCGNDTVAGSDYCAECIDGYRGEDR